MEAARWFIEISCAISGATGGGPGVLFCDLSDAEKEATYACIRYVPSFFKSIFEAACFGRIAAILASDLVAAASPATVAAGGDPPTITRVGLIFRLATRVTQLWAEGRDASLALPGIDVWEALAILLHTNPLRDYQPSTAADFESLHDVFDLIEHAPRMPPFSSLDNASELQLKCAALILPYTYDPEIASFGPAPSDAAS